MFLRPQVEKSYLGSNDRCQYSDSGTKSKSSSHLKAFLRIKKGSYFFIFVGNIEERWKCGIEIEKLRKKQEKEPGQIFGKNKKHD